MSAFWQNVVAGLIVFVPTVALAAVLLWLDRLHQRNDAIKNDDKLRRALLANLYVELIDMRSFVTTYVKMSKDAKTNQRIADTPTHRPARVVWEHSQHELTRLGLPGRARVALAITYSNVVSLENWTNHIYALGQNSNSLAVLRSQIESFEFAESVYQYVEVARTEIEIWAKEIHFDVEKDTGISDYVKTKYRVAPIPPLPSKN